MTRTQKNIVFWVVVLVIPILLLEYSKGESRTYAQSSTQPQTQKAIQFIHAASGPARPFSPAVRANGFLILSGQIGADSSGKIVSGGIQAETRQAMENIKKVLTQNGSSLDRVAKCTVFLGDMAEWATMNDVYVTFFNEARRPARSAMGANGLALGAKVEIECLAVE